MNQTTSPSCKVRLRALAAVIPCLLISSIPASSFLPPDLNAGTTSPTLARAGVVLPLRPEMLPDKEPSGKVPVVTPTKRSNGIHLFTYQDASLPRVDIVFQIRAGAVGELTGKQGAAELTAQTIRSGGSTTRTPEEVDRLLESMGASLFAVSGPEAITIRVATLARSADKAFEVVSDLIQNPRFDEKAFETQREILADTLLRNDDDPGEVARRLFRQVVYGGVHPLGRTATTSTVQAITREDLIRHHQAYFAPQTISIGVSGAATERQVAEWMKQHWDKWNPKSKPQAWPVPSADKAWDTTAGVVLLTKRTQQTQIRVGHIGLPRKHPDRYAVTLLNGVFGQGGFSSRLMDRVRSMKGLAYGAGGAVTSDNPAGLFFAVAATQARTTNAALREILAIIRETATGDIKPEELKTARQDLIYSYLAEFSTPGAILDKSMTAHFQGEDPDFLSRFVERIRAVTLEEVNAAARNHIHPDRLKIVLVGFEKAFERPADEFGPVTRVADNGIPIGDTGIPKPPEGRSNNASPSH